MLANTGSDSEPSSAGPGDIGLLEGPLDTSIAAKDAIATELTSGFGVVPWQTASLSPDLSVVCLSGTLNKSQGIAGGMVHDGLFEDFALDPSLPPRRMSL